MNHLLVIASTQRSEMDEALLRLAEWMGLETEVETVPDPSRSIDEFAWTYRQDQTCVALSADIFVLISQLFNTGPALAQFFSERSLRCLVYGFCSLPSHATALKNLAGWNISGLESLPKGPRRYRFTTEGKTWLQSLSGLDFTEESGVASDAFTVTSSATDEITPLLFAEDRPVFIHSKAVPGSDVFLWATTRIADIGAPIQREIELARYCHWLLPAIIFLKASFGSRCWHNPNLRARLIIDDPLLQSQYGFLRYDALLDSMQRVPYGTSIAFIPWNYRRSRQAVANLFLKNTSRLSLCVHGCDHTNREFDCDDENHLIQKANLALHRMRQHHETSGVPYEKIMVFPQGVFSVAAIRVLRKSGYLAVVNSTCYPGKSGGTFPLGDLLLPAMCRFHGFPIFPRRDATRIFDIAVDLFLGKAGFVVEHHEFVQEGYHKWEDFAGQINSLDDHLVWPTLVETITESCLQKVAGENRLEIRFFTHTFRWHNQSERPVHTHLSKFDPEPALIKEIRVNGQVLPFQVNQSFIHLDILVAPKAVIEVEVLDKETPSILPLTTSIGYMARTGLRRYLSEFRDNRLARYPQLLGYAKTVARHFKLTGDSRIGGSR